MITAAQIVTQALTIAKAPGMSAFGGQCLNLVLADLVLHRNLQMNRYSTTVAVTANSNGPFNLTADYLRTYDLFYTQDNLPYFLRPISFEQYDAEFKDPSIANYPYEFAVDTQPQAATPDTGIPLLYVYPQSSSALTLTHRYMVRRADISSPQASSSIPWFPDQDYLIRATALRMFDLTDDARRESFTVMCENMLRSHLIMEGTEQQVVKAIKLDSRRFRSNRSVRPTKTQPY